MLNDRVQEMIREMGQLARQIKKGSQTDEVKKRKIRKIERKRVKREKQKSNFHNKK